MGEIKRLFATAATADREGAGVGVIWWAVGPPDGYALSLLDYRICEMADVNAQWIRDFFWRSIELDNESHAEEIGCHLRVEHSGLLSILERADEAFRDTKDAGTVNRSAFAIDPIRQFESAKWPATLDDRVSQIRPLVNSKRVVRGPGLPWFSFRGLRVNHLREQVGAHRTGDAASAGELLQAFILGVLIGTTPEPIGWFDKRNPFCSGSNTPPKSNPASGPFGGGYVKGQRPL